MSTEYGSNEKERVELQNGSMRLTVDPDTGSIDRIEDTDIGTVHIDANRDGRKDGRLFRLIVPEQSWWARYADSQEQSLVICERDDDRLVIEYPNLEAVDGTQIDVDVRVEIRPDDGSEEFLLTMQIENHGSQTVLNASFPLLGGWYQQHSEDEMALGANEFVKPQLLTTSAGSNYARNGRRSDWTYPVDLWCPWIDLPSPTGGLSYLNYMTNAHNGKFWVENMAGYGDEFRLMGGWLHQIALQPGDSWTSPTMGLAVHDGDWHATADRYRAWFTEEFSPKFDRPNLRSRIGFQNVFFRGFDGTPIRSLDAIPDAAEAGRQYGVDMLCVWDMLLLGNYARFDPKDLTDYSQKNRDTIQRGLRQAETEGTRTCALINFRHPNVALHLDDPDMSNRVQQRYSGTFRTENYSANHTFGDIYSSHIGPESYVFSPFADEHRERVLRLTQDYLDLGFTSMFYDQPFEFAPDYGFIDSGHRPDFTHHEAVELVGNVRESLLENESQAVVIGEECDILATPYIDQWMTWSIAEPSEDLLERVSMIRYAIPHTILSWVVDHQLERAALAFAMGMQLCLMVHGGEGTLEDEPEFAERVQALADLRKRTAERTVLARFQDRVGLKIDGDDRFVAYAYDSDSGPAVIVTAWGEEARGEVTVNFEAFTAPGSAEEGAVYHLDGTQEPHSGSTREFDLVANEVAVWTL